MSLIAASARNVFRLQRAQALRHRSWKACGFVYTISQRSFYDGGQNLVVEEVVALHEKEGDSKRYLNEYKASFTAPKPDFVFNKTIPLSQIGETVTAVGFVGKRRNIGKALTFAPLYGGFGLDAVQIFARSELNDIAKKALREITENSAVSVTGILDWKYEEKSPRKEPEPDMHKEGHCLINEVEIRVQRIDCLSSFPKELKTHHNQNFDPRYRHLQIRFDDELRKRLEFRSRVAAFARSELSDFQEVETPILFKSTPEGAREFIVPTRRKGYAYGLPQSPQQYKQILMASGIYRYVQFAKCFRDEDHRADRQPEFTQIDLEMAWANGEDVMQRVEQFMKAIWQKFAKPGTVISSPLPGTTFPRMTYDVAMSRHGSDKPDLRVKGLIHRVEHIVPADLRGMLTSVENPIIEACKIRLDGDTTTVQKFIRGFMDSTEAEIFRSNVDGAPGIFVVDLGRPLEGLQAFGFEGVELFKNFYAEADNSEGEFKAGDLILLQARPYLPHTGGSTMLGKLRLAVHKAALEKRLIKHDASHNFLWITDFPMFTANDGSEPGQGGDCGFSATHHPFTAPKTIADVDLLLTDPLKAIADHYDLVLNGVELGGGSRRIHNAEMQKFVMREILKMSARRMTDFSHLFLALGAGCPPHAGLAIGFDRLIAVMQGRDSVRDVIAFPKDKNGSDLMARAPTQLSKKRLGEYHLQIKDDTLYLEEAKSREIEEQKVQALEKLKTLLEAITTFRERPTMAQAPTNDELINDKSMTDERMSNEATDDNTVYLEEIEEIDNETAQSLPSEALPRYRPGQLLPYAVTLYNQVGGKFLLDSLKAFEDLIESLGKDIHDEAGLAQGITKTKRGSIVQRLQLLHSELVQEVLYNLRSIEAVYKKADNGISTKEVRFDLEECLEPAKILYSSLKTLEPMLENLTNELERSIHAIRDDGNNSDEGAVPIGARGIAEKEEVSSKFPEAPSDPGNLPNVLPNAR